MRKQISFTFDNTVYTAPINDCVPDKGAVVVLANEYNMELVDEHTSNPAIKLYVKCWGAEKGRIYALFYSIKNKEFDSNFTVN